MSNIEGMTKPKLKNDVCENFFVIRGFGFPSSFVTRASSFYHAIGAISGVTGSAGVTDCTGLTDLTGGACPVKRP
jgi:hypothetical protein